jgi:two-component system sensor histidine kinase DesK
VKFKAARSDGPRSNAWGESAPNLGASLSSWPGMPMDSPLRRRLRWFLACIWLVYLLGPIGDLAHGSGHAWPYVTVGLVLVLAFSGCYVYVAGAWDRDPSTWLRYGVLGTQIGLAVVLCVVFGSGWLGLWIYVAGAVGCALPASMAFRGVLCVVAAYLGCVLITHCSVDVAISVLLPVTVSGLMLIGFRRQTLLVVELSQTKETVARLAANEERLRLARDLHDLTGHSLSLITLKAELAHKVLDQIPPGAARDLVAREIADIERVSRQTLQDIREAVSGYRRPTLPVELATARTALRAAGIELDAPVVLDCAHAELDADLEAVLAWCLREAVTNVIKHAGATTCAIRLRRAGPLVTLEVCDNGTGDNGTGVGGAGVGGAGDSAGRGSGLHGMAERLAAVDGKLSVGPTERGGGGFRLTATVNTARAESTETDDRRLSGASVAL